MKIAFFVLLMVLLTNLSFAESLKERLKRARAQEAGLVETTPLPTEKGEITLKQEMPEKKIETQCQQDAEYADGKPYYFECYCTALKYPETEKMLKRHGLILEPVGIIEMGNGVTHFDPKEREKYRYRCGYNIKWGSKNDYTFKNAEACYDFTRKIAENIREKELFSIRTLNYGCSAFVVKQ